MIEVVTLSMKNFFFLFLKQTNVQTPMVQKTVLQTAALIPGTTINDGSLDSRYVHVSVYISECESMCVYDCVICMYKFLLCNFCGTCEKNICQLIFTNLFEITDIFLNCFRVYVCLYVCIFVDFELHIFFEQTLLQVNLFKKN